jgi:cell division septal protein FtsQ
MRYRIAQLAQLLPDFENRELVYIYNIAKNHRYNQNRLVILDEAKKNNKEIDDRAISITLSNIAAFEWAIEETTGERFQIIDWIVNEDLEKL